ncbi:autotransporter outer membrane beta-barrel domain-containing protein [Brucella sp. 21LCYQ03]|nr:autotransporter outer membrane beta-barrel domain-containing protein [Brucella sp. 21LCYQ03]
MTAIALLQSQSNAYAEFHSDDGLSTINGGASNCTVVDQAVGSAGKNGVGNVSSCMFAYASSKATSVTFDGNVTYTIKASDLSVMTPKSYFAGLVVAGGGEMTVNGNYTISGLGTAGDVKSPLAALSSYYSLQASPDNGRWQATKTDIKGNLNVDAGMLFYQGASHYESGAGVVPPKDNSALYGSLTVGGTTTMVVSPSAKMFYNNGSAAVVAPMTLNDTHADFNGAVNFNLPLLTPTDKVENQSVYGAIVMAGTNVSLNFNKGGTYTLSQQYNPNLSGVKNTSDIHQSGDTNYPAIYGWVMLSGQWDAGGRRGGGAPDASDTYYPNVAQFSAQNMMLNYTMKDDGPSGPWGVVSLNQHAHAALTNTTMNLDMQGSAASRASVFLSGITPFATSINDKDPTPATFADNIFDLNKVQVNFTEAHSGKYVSLFDIDATFATVNVTNGSKLVAPGNSAIADRSLIYINKTTELPISPGDAHPYDDPEGATLIFHATDSTLGGGIYVDDVDDSGKFTAKNLLTYTMDGTTTWAGDLFVASSVTGEHPEQFASAQMTIAGQSHWTGDVTSHNGNVVLKLNQQGIWTPTADVSAGSFVQGKITMNGGIIQAGTKALNVDVPLELNGLGGSFDTNGHTINYGASITGDATLYKIGDGVLVLNGTTHAAITYLKGGELSVNADSHLGGGNAHRIEFGGGILQVTGTTMHSTAATIQLFSEGGGFDIVDSGNTFTVDQKLSAGGSLTKLGAGTLVLSGDNLYKGGTYLNGGTLQVASDANLGDASGALNFDTGTLHLTNTMNSSRAVLLTSHGGTISVDANKTATFGGIFKNALKATGSLTKSGDGTLIMTAANTYTGGTTVSGGILQLGDGVTDGSITNAIALNGGNLVVDNIGATALASVISGTGSLTQNGAGTLTLSGNNGYSGGTSLNAGVISAEQDENLGTGPLNFDGGTLQIMGTHFTNTTKQIVWGAHGGSFDIDDANNHFALSNVFTGSGALTKTGAGTLALTGDSSGYQGNTTVSQGSLRLDGGKLGNGAGAVHVASGGSLGGHGTIGDTTDIATGGTLFAQSGQKLTFDKDLTLNTGSIVSVDLGAPNASGLFDVKGNLTLAGTLNITDAGGFGPGRYRIFEYGGTLTDNTLSLGTVPNGDTGWSILTSTPHQVNLVNSAGAILSFWDGQDTSKHDNNLVDGGDGTWDASNANWTDQDGSFNKKWDNNQFAIFEGTAGTVTVATNFKPTVKGLQFFVDGYTVTGGAITLGGADNQINVGDGTQDSASYVATIASVLEGQNGFTKVNYGTLNLTGQNIYSGTTTVKDGTLELSGNGSIANSAEIVLASSRFGQSGLLINKDQDFNLANKVSGIGAVTKDGNSTTTFAGNNTFSGGLTVKGGTAKAGIADNAFGSGNVMVNGGARLDLANLNQSVGSLLGGKTGDGAINLGSGTLTLNQNLHGDFSGKISGTGGITKTNDGDLVLYGANDYSGVTAINEGALVQGAAGGFSSASTFNVASGASLQLEGFATNMAGLSNAGNVFFGGINATVLNVSGDYNGNGGTLHMSAVFGDDNSVADRLNVGGSTSGSTHIDITNRDGFGAKTNNGIEIVSVGGNSLGAFTLNGDYVTKDGQQAIMTNTAYAYTLQKGGTNTPNDGNWYLVSSNNTPVPPVDPDCQTTNTCPTPPAPGPNPDPAPGRYSAAAPVYESYTSTLQALNALPTLQQRVGQRYLGGADQAGSGASSGARSGESDNKAIWGRIEGAHNRQENRSTAGDLHQDINTLIMQAGVDGQFYENENGKLFAGITGQYGNARSDVDNRTGDGSGTIDTQGWGLGATATWYGTSGFYLDGQAQVNWYDSDLDVDAANPTLKNGNKGIGYALSIEAGQRFAMNQNWSLTPQAQLMWSSVDFDTFSDTYGARISNRSSDSLTARLGLAANYANSWKGNDGRMVNTSLYGIANLYQELMGDARINYAGTHMATDSDDTWGGIGAGGAYAWADGKYVFYGEGSVGTALNHFADSYKIKGNIGFKVNW